MLTKIQNFLQKITGQNDEKNIDQKEITFKIDGMHCVSCSLSIDLELEDLEGVKMAKTNFAKSQTKVIFDTKKTDEKKIKNLIKGLGYKVV